MRQFFILLMTLLPTLLFAQNHVGINVDTAEVTLDVRSLDEMQVPGLQLATPLKNHFLRLFAGHEGNQRPYLLYHEDDTFRIATSLPSLDNFKEKITLLPNGKVGIGFSLPPNKLHLHDEALFELLPPFDGFYGNNNYLQITNGLSGNEIDETEGLLMGVNLSGFGDISNASVLMLRAGLTHVEMSNSVVSIDSNLWVSGNINIASLAGEEDLHLIIDPDGNLKTGPSGEDTDWIETDDYVYNITKNIGIGEDEPSAPLMVRGPINDGFNSTVKIYNETVTGDPPFEITSTHLMQLDGNSIDISASGLNKADLTLQSISMGGITMVTGGGNVGVGTVVPLSRKMTVSGLPILVNQSIYDAKATFSILNTGQQGFSEMLFDGDHIETVERSLKLNDISEHDVILANGGGNVGIGVNPNSRLTIEGPQNTGSTAGLEIRTAGFGEILLLDGNEIEAVGFNNTLSLNPYAGGPVTIGTLFPATGYKLSVAGKVIAEEIRCQLQTAWPDYVFKEDYPLMSLDAMAEDIKTNGHLPGIPAAAEIDGKGLDLGDMQVRMMEKIEELTLYILQLHDRIADLEKNQQK